MSPILVFERNAFWGYYDPFIEIQNSATTKDIGDDDNCSERKCVVKQTPDLDSANPKTSKSSGFLYLQWFFLIDLEMTLILI